MKKIWNHLKADSEIINAYKLTTYLANQQVEQLMEVGLEAFSRWEEASRDLKDLHEELQSKDIELKRLEASEENNRANITVRFIYAFSYFYGHFLLIFSFHVTHIPFTMHANRTCCRPSKSLRVTTVRHLR